MGRASVIPNDAILSFTGPGGVELTITWADLAAELLLAEIGEQLVLQGGSPADPSLSWGDGDSGFCEPVDDQLVASVAGSSVWQLIGGQMQSTNGNSWVLTKPSASNVVPTICPQRQDINSGIGQDQNDSLSLISGGVEGLRLTEVGSGIIQVPHADVGLTADVGSAQGNGVIVSSYNVYSTVANAGDAATLPAVFAVNSLVYVKNDAAANSMDVFPASGDDAGLGTDTVVPVIAGDFVVFMATGADATWTRIMAGSI